MKKSFVLLLSFLFMALISCKKDDINITRNSVENLTPENSIEYVYSQGCKSAPDYHGDWVFLSVHHVGAENHFFNFPNDIYTLTFSGDSMYYESLPLLGVGKNINLDCSLFQREDDKRYYLELNGDTLTQISMHDGTVWRLKKIE